MKKLILLLSLLLPATARRRLLSFIPGYEIAPTSHIGRAWVDVESLRMEAGSQIGDGTVIKGLYCLSVGRDARIGRLNWITAYPRSGDRHFQHIADRDPSLRLGEHAAITNRHLIDCTQMISIGPFTTVAGFRSQLLTHSIDLQTNRQDAAPIRIGAHCFVSTGCLVLGGAQLPDRSVLAAGSVLRTAETSDNSLYGGVPARWIKGHEGTGQYFRRTTGFVK
jgi:acetyltransferase-like isoleucine patch superfamily enzyme